jgi:heme/copper-type cytochrome/quinol oxidase subunit 2
MIMENSLMTLLLIIGIAFIVFGVLVVFLPEVREKRK